MYPTYFAGEEIQEPDATLGNVGDETPLENDADKEPESDVEDEDFIDEDDEDEDEDDDILDDTGDDSDEIEEV